VRSVALVVVGMLVGGVDVVRAQIIDSRARGGGQPIAWTSLSVGWMSHADVCDPDANACWQFGGAPQFRATLEMPMGRGASIGVAGTHARIPLTYQGGVLSGCNGCDADANISQLLANLRIGGASGFHQVIDLNAGMTFYSNFRSTEGTKLDPSKPLSAFNFAVGYGFGYSLSERFQIMLVQDYGLVIHKRMPGSPGNTAQQSTTRVGARYGLGSRSRGF
jgi:hypothetical protein